METSYRAILGQQQKMQQSPLNRLHTGTGFHALPAMVMESGFFGIMEVVVESSV